MCFGQPRKSLEIARSRLTPEQWAKFEREFDDFCVICGLQDSVPQEARDWAKWALCWSRPVEPLWVDIRTRNAYFEKIALAMMDDEQAEQSLERWKGKRDEAGLQMLVEGE